MSNPYEVEHNITAATSTRGPSHRPDMTSFFSALSQISTSEEPIDGTPTHNNPHAVPTPVSYAATARLLQDQILVHLRQQHPGDEDDEDTLDPSLLTADDNPTSHATLLTSLLSTLSASITSPPTEVEGVSQSYLDALDRIDKRHLSKTDTCPICAERYLDDQYPLVVRLPCHERHWFCLECVGPWLRFKGSCPLDRKMLGERRRKVVDVVEDEEEDLGDYA